MDENKGQDKSEQNSIGFSDVLRSMALGMSPAAPRLPEQALANGMFGGYPKGFTATRGFRGTLNFSTLRQIAWRSPVLSAILSTRLHQLSRYARRTATTKKHEVGYRVVHKRQHDPHFKVDEGFKELCIECEKMMEKPWRVFWDTEEGGSVYRDIEPSMSTFLTAVTEDLLIINRPVIELGLDINRIPRAFGAIDGANIIPTFAAMKFITTRDREFPKDYEQSWANYRRVLQMSADKYQINIDERTEYIYMLYGRPSAGFRHDELLIAPWARQTDITQTGYPRSMTERAIFILLAEIMAMTANQKYFEFGSMAEVMMAIRGNYGDQHVKDIENVMQANMTGVPGMFRVPLIALPGGAQDLNVIPIKQNHRDMLFDVYIQKLTNLACAVFRMHPSEINEAPRAGDNSASLGQASQTKQINMAQEQGLESALLHVKTSIFDPILERIDENLMFEWDNGENEVEQVTTAQLYAPITTINERRMMLGLDPFPDDDDRGDVVDNQFVQAKEQAAMQQKMQQDQMKAAQQGQGQGGPQDEGDQQGDEDNEQQPDKSGGQGGGVFENPPWSRKDEDTGRRAAGQSKRT